MIEAAARALKPGGRFYMVANRGLPYEPMLKANFASFETLADNNKFKVTKADRRASVVTEGVAEGRFGGGKVPRLRSR